MSSIDEYQRLAKLQRDRARQQQEQQQSRATPPRATLRQGAAAPRNSAGSANAGSSRQQGGRQQQRPPVLTRSPSANTSQPKREDAARLLMRNNSLSSTPTQPSQPPRSPQSSFNNNPNNKPTAARPLSAALSSSPSLKRGSAPPPAVLSRSSSARQPPSLTSSPSLKRNTAPSPPAALTRSSSARQPPSLTSSPSLKHGTVNNAPRSMSSQQLPPRPRSPNMSSQPPRPRSPNMSAQQMLPPSRSRSPNMITQQPPRPRSPNMSAQNPSSRPPSHTETASTRGVDAPSSIVSSGSRASSAALADSERIRSNWRRVASLRRSGGIEVPTAEVPVMQTNAAAAGAFKGGNDAALLNFPELYDPSSSHRMPPLTSKVPSQTYLGGGSSSSSTAVHLAVHEPGSRPSSVTAVLREGLQPRSVHSQAAHSSSTVPPDTKGNSPVPIPFEHQQMQQQIQALQQQLQQQQAQQQQQPPTQTQQQQQPPAADMAPIDPHTVPNTHSTPPSKSHSQSNPAALHKEGSAGGSSVGKMLKSPVGQLLEGLLSQLTGRSPSPLRAPPAQQEVSATEPARQLPLHAGREEAVAVSQEQPQGSVWVGGRGREAWQSTDAPWAEMGRDAGGDGGMQDEIKQMQAWVADRDGSAAGRVQQQHAQYQVLPPRTNLPVQGQQQQQPRQISPGRDRLKAPFQFLSSHPLSFINSSLTNNDQHTNRHSKQSEVTGAEGLRGRHSDSGSSGVHQPGRRERRSLARSLDSNGFLASNLSDSSTLRSEMAQLEAEELTHGSQHLRRLHALQITTALRESRTRRSLQNRLPPSAHVAYELQQRQQQRQQEQSQTEVAAHKQQQQQQPNHPIPDPDGLQPVSAKRNLNFRRRSEEESAVLGELLRSVPNQGTALPASGQHVRTHSQAWADTHNVTEDWLRSAAATSEAQVDRRRRSPAHLPLPARPTTNPQHLLLPPASLKEPNATGTHAAAPVLPTLRSSTQSWLELAAAITEPNSLCGDPPLPHTSPMLPSLPLTNEQPHKQQQRGSQNNQTAADVFEASASDDALAMEFERLLSSVAGSAAPSRPLSSSRERGQVGQSVPETAEAMQQAMPVAGADSGAKQEGSKPQSVSASSNKGLPQQQQGQTDAAAAHEQQQQQQEDAKHAEQEQAAALKVQQLFRARAARKEAAAQKSKEQQEQKQQDQQRRLEQMQIRLQQQQEEQQRQLKVLQEQQAEQRRWLEKQQHQDLGQWQLLQQRKQQEQQLLPQPQQLPHILALMPPSDPSKPQQQPQLQAIDQHQLMAILQQNPGILDQMPNQQLVREMYQQQLHEFQQQQDQLLPPTHSSEDSFILPILFLPSGTHGHPDEPPSSPSSAVPDTQDWPVLDLLLQDPPLLTHPSQQCPPLPNHKQPHSPAHLTHALLQPPTSPTHLSSPLLHQQPPPSPNHDQQPPSPTHPTSTILPQQPPSPNALSTSAAQAPQHSLPSSPPHQRVAAPQTHSSPVFAPSSPQATHYPPFFAPSSPPASLVPPSAHYIANSPSQVPQPAPSPSTNSGHPPSLTQPSTQPSSLTHPFSSLGTSSAHPDHSNTSSTAKAVTAAVMPTEHPTEQLTAQPPAQPIVHHRAPDPTDVWVPPPLRGGERGSRMNEAPSLGGMQRQPSPGRHLSPGRQALQALTRSPRANEIGRFLVKGAAVLAAGRLGANIAQAVSPSRSRTEKWHSDKNRDAVLAEVVHPQFDKGSAISEVEVAIAQPRTPYKIRHRQEHRQS